MKPVRSLQIYIVVSCISVISCFLFCFSRFSIGVRFQAGLNNHQISICVNKYWIYMDISRFCPIDTHTHTHSHARARASHIHIDFVHVHRPVPPRPLWIMIMSNWLWNWNRSEWIGRETNLFQLKNILLARFRLTQHGKALLNSERMPIFFCSPSHPLDCRLHIQSKLNVRKSISKRKFN